MKTLKVKTNYVFTITKDIEVPDDFDENEIDFGTILDKLSDEVTDEELNDGAYEANRTVILVMKNDKILFED